MEDISAILKQQPATTFSIVHYSGLIYPEIDPQFVHHFFNQLKSKWYIMKNEDISCMLTFKKDYENPNITKGWADLKHIFNLHDDVEVKLSYYPPKIFALDSFKKLNNQLEIPSFHSRSLNPTETCYFDIMLTENNIKLPTLKLPNEFAQFLKECEMDYLILCGERNLKQTLAVINANDTTKTELGDEWKSLCQINFFEIGDKIRFKFDLNDNDQRCHVFKISD